MPVEESILAFPYLDASLTLKEMEVEVDETYYCPHRPEENCECRKPQLGMIQKAMENFDIDLYKFPHHTCDIEYRETIIFHISKVVTMQN